MFSFQKTSISPSFSVIVDPRTPSPLIQLVAIVFDSRHYRAQHAPDRLRPYRLSTLLHSPFAPADLGTYERNPEQNPAPSLPLAKSAVVFVFSSRTTRLDGVTRITANPRITSDPRGQSETVTQQAESLFTLPIINLSIIGSIHLTTRARLAIEDLLDLVGSSTGGLWSMLNVHHTEDPFQDGWVAAVKTVACLLGLLRNPTRDSTLMVKRVAASSSRVQDNLLSAFCAATDPSILAFNGLSTDSGGALIPPH
ncbi:hypothetical protein D9619_012287 [Psilocybe cf. subviscida]|uniref:Uncharacterized protein n=1 Tax=Psilocybe cf. subviscida TaxID=2480587 RepID=A0A8H5ERB8_9AGAR|nr:hypothetical protein D9619_012287 [Psilocybe cf. subviscida]